MREPPVDVIREGGEFLVEVLLPGILETDIDVRLVGTRLIIHAERPETHATYLSREIPRGILVREVLLPDLLEIAHATFDEGLLLLRLRRREGA